MNIGARLETLGHMVPTGSSLADIGTDHAYLPVWLIKNNIITRAVAADIAAGPCQAARETVAAYGMRNVVEVRQGNGLMAVAPGEVDTVAIAGMGASTMIEILEQSPEVTATVKTLVLQPMIGAANLRRWAYDHGFMITAEALAEEAGRLYEMMALVPAENKADRTPLTDVEAEIGPCLLKQRPALFSKHVSQLAHHYHSLLAKMAHSDKARASAKFVEFTGIYKQLEALNNDCQGK